MRHGALPRHPRRQRGHLVERHVRVVPDAPFRGTERDVVLDAVSGEDLDFPAVHLDGTRDDDLPLWTGENVPDAGVEIEDAGGPVELLEHRPEDGAVLGHGSLYVVSGFGRTDRMGS